MLVDGAYSKRVNGGIVCKLCIFNCFLSPGSVGKCSVRCNIGGTLYLTAYGSVSKVRVVPKRRVPLVYGRSGHWLKVGILGCNLRCAYCFNWDVAYGDAVKAASTVQSMTPDELVQEAVLKGCVGICFSYTEPTVCVEYVLDVFEKAKSFGLSTCVHTNGLFGKDVAKDLSCVCDVFIFDVKAYSKDVYRRITGNSYHSIRVLENMQHVYSQGSNVEVVTTIIPGYNDSVFEVRSILRWILVNLSEDVVWHLYPCRPVPNLYNVGSVPADKLIKISEIAISEGLKRVVLHT